MDGKLLCTSQKLIYIFYMCLVCTMCLKVQFKSHIFFTVLQQLRQKAEQQFVWRKGLWGYHQALPEFKLTVNMI